MTIRLSFKYRVAVFLLRLLAATWRIRISGEMPKEKGVIAFWHGYMMPVWKYFSKRKPGALISSSKDGQILTELLEKWGYNVVRGSSHKRGREALREMTLLSGDRLFLITPDGPRGPERKFKAGAVITAQRASVPLYLCGVRIRNAKIFGKSWDHFMLPLPFSKIDLFMPDGIIIPADADKEQINSYICKCESELNRLY